MGGRTSRMAQGAPARTDRAKKVIFSALLAVFLAVSLYAVARLAVNRLVIFPIKRVEVTGNRHLGDDEVVRLAGLSEGVSILSVSSKGVARLLGESPWVREVSIRKELPDRVLIRIRETEPLAILRKGGEHYLVDATGTLLERQSTEERFLPVITGSPRGERPLREAIAFAGVLRGFGPQFSKGAEIQVDDVETMTYRNGATVLRVGMGNYEEKLRRYLELRDEIVRRGIPVAYIDLRYARRVIVKTAAGGAS